MFFTGVWLLLLYLTACQARGSPPFVAVVWWPAQSVLLLVCHYRERVTPRCPFELSSTLLLGSWCCVSLTDTSAKTHSFALSCHAWSWNAREIQKGASFVFRWNALVRRRCLSCPFIWMFSRLVPISVFVWDETRTLDLCSRWFLQCDSSSYACKFTFSLLFKGMGGEASVNVLIDRERCIYNFFFFLFCNLFPIFLYFLVFANGHLHLYE